jgi:hypothetical protein
MDIYELRVREHEAHLADQVERPVVGHPSTSVLWVALAIVGAVLTVATREQEGLGMFLGLGLLLVGTAGLRVAGRLPGTPTTHDRPTRTGGAPRSADDASRPGPLDEAIVSIPVGPTPNK